MTDSGTIYPHRAARTLALHSQQLASNHSSQSGLDDLYAAIDRIGCVQIDTLQMVQRSQYLTLWSRLGNYNPADFDRLAYGSSNSENDRRLFEYWLHAACIIPLTEFRYRLPRMHHHRSDVDGWHSRWLAEPGSAAILEHVRQRIQEEGAQRASDFEHDGSRRGTWWDWKPAKRALEILYNRGELMIAGRQNFQRIYDLQERVLPDWVDTTVPTVGEVRQHYVERAAKALGICTPLQVADYTHMKRTAARPHVERAIASGLFREITVEMADQKPTSMIVHRDNLPLLDQAADGSLVAERTTFLSPFDNLFWARDRDLQLWNFHQTLEAYRPAPQRQWGYFCLPILHRDRLVGRFDPKLERKTGTLRLKALYLEPGFELTEDLIADVAVAMRDFLAFHKATELVIERSEPAEFGDRLLAAL